MKIAGMTAAVALTAAAALHAAAPAQAAPPLCFKDYELVRTTSAVMALGTKSCDDQPPLPISVGLERFDAGAWHLVAVGTGVAKFNCFGTGTRKYRHAQAPGLTLTTQCT